MVSQVAQKTKIRVEADWGPQQEQTAATSSKAVELAEFSRGVIDRLIKEVNAKWSRAIGEVISLNATQLFCLPFDSEDMSYRRAFNDFQPFLGVHGLFTGLELFDTRTLGGLYGRQASEELYIPSLGLNDAEVTGHERSFKHLSVPLNKVSGPISVV